MSPADGNARTAAQKTQDALRAFHEEGALGKAYDGRLLARDTVTKLAAGTLTPGQASFTKLWISEAELASSRDLAGIDPATGLLAGSPRMGDLFSAIGATIYSGTSDIQRRIIAAELGIVE